MAAQAIALRRLIVDPVTTTCAGRVFVVPVWPSLANS
jgi:hypothetical protein